MRCQILWISEVGVASNCLPHWRPGCGQPLEMCPLANKVSENPLKIKKPKTTTLKTKCRLTICSSPICCWSNEHVITCSIHVQSLKFRILFAAPRIWKLRAVSSTSCPEIRHTENLKQPEKNLKHLSLSLPCVHRIDIFFNDIKLCIYIYNIKSAADEWRALNSGTYFPNQSFPPIF
jgi:hypothetical protein